MRTRLLPTLAPGLGVVPSTGTYTTGGETGSLTCVGTVDGKPITGVGTWGQVGRYGVLRQYACTDVEGDAVQRTSMTLPTATGPVHITDDPTRITLGPLRGGGVLGGTFAGPRFFGTFSIGMVKGNCVTVPLTKVHVSLQGRLVDRP